ncbi:MAG: hypothetical protein GYA33_04580 [Thermogutta sp.]|nr:hypothetical protein [Thermogutta sp.]
MKKFAALLVVVSLGLFTVGCPQSAEQPAESGTPPAQGQTEGTGAEGSGSTEAAPADTGAAPADAAPAEGSPANQ